MSRENACSRGTWRVLTETQSRRSPSSCSACTKLVGGRAMPLTSITSGISSPSGISRHAPPRCPMLATAKLRSGSSEKPFGRKPSTSRPARNVCRPSARRQVMPPRLSETNTSPLAVVTTHSGRARSWPTNCRSDTATLNDVIPLPRGARMVPRKARHFNSPAALWRGPRCAHVRYRPRLSWRGAVGASAKLDTDSPSRRTGRRGGSG